MIDFKINSNYGNLKKIKINHLINLKMMKFKIEEVQAKCQIKLAVN